MDKHTKASLLVLIGILTASLLYHFIVRPMHRDNELGRCLEQAESHSSRILKQEARDNCFKQFK